MAFSGDVCGGVAAGPGRIRQRRRRARKSLADAGRRKSDVARNPSQEGEDSAIAAG
jgi:hypothetical protein